MPVKTQTRCLPSCRPARAAQLPLGSAAWLTMLAVLLCALAPSPAAGEPLAPPLGRWQPALAPEALPADRGPDAAELERGGAPAHSAGAPGQAPAKMPVAHPLQTRIDVTRYELDLAIDPHREVLEGVVCIRARVLEGPLGVLALDLLAPMVATRAWRVDRTLEAKLTQGDGLVLIDMGRTFAAGETLSVHVEFRGRPEPYGIYGFKFYQTSVGTAAAASLSEPWGARSWWPCKDDVADKAPFSVTLRVPGGMTGVSNGILVDSSPAAAGTPPAGPQPPGAPAKRPLSVFVWEEPLPMATYQFGVAVADYVQLDDLYVGGADTLALRHWVYPAFADRARSDFAVLPAMLAFCESRFGPYPYPGQKYGMVLFEWEGAMEHPTATTYASHFVTGTGYYETIIMHELAHQWFGDAVTLQDWTHTWLHEGFATYVEAMWKEHLGGPPALVSFMKARSDFTWWRDPLVRQPDRTDPWFYFKNMVYYKGAWVLHMLRRHLGEAAFGQCLRQFAEGPAFRHGNATSADFAATCETVSGQELDWFFEQWLHRRVQPILRVAWRNLGSGLAEVRIEQTQAADPVYGDLPFRLPVELRLRGSGLDQTVTVWSTGRDQTHPLAPGVPLTSVTVDPGAWLLHKLESVQQQTEGPRPRVTLETAAPNPFNPRCRLVWSSDLPTSDRVEIFDLRGRRVDGRSWPRQPAGQRSWTWEGRDQQGRDCPTGVYFYRVICHPADGGPPEVLRGKLALAR